MEGKNKNANHPEILKQNAILATANKCELCFATFSAANKMTELMVHVENKHPKVGTFQTCFPTYEKVQELLKDMTTKNKPKDK